MKLAAAHQQERERAERMEAVMAKLLSAHDELRKIALATTRPERQTALLHHERAGLLDALGAIEDSLTVLKMTERAR